MLKKFMSLLCVGLMSFAFVGCDAGANSEPAGDNVDVTIEEGAEDAATEEAAVDADADAAATN